MKNELDNIFRAFLMTVLMAWVIAPTNIILASDFDETIQAACTDPAWSPSATYVKGNRVSYNNNVYEANWWTMNENPEQNSGPWAVWKLIGACGGNASPTISLTSPANNTSFTAPASITISANATDSDGSISKVDFYNGSTLLGTDTSSPYSFNWSNVASGTYAISAKATDNSGAVGTSGTVTVTVTSASNPAPTTSITSPANNSSFTAPANISIAATASDNGSITKVEFFNGSTKLGEDTSSPYTYSWTNVGAGTYSISSRATDNLGATGNSSLINITVNGSTGDCPHPQYVENGGYAAGSRVKNVGNAYECKPSPYSGWCNGAAWAYAPGTGAHWQDAWLLVGPCEGSNNSGPSVVITAPANNSTVEVVGSTVNITATATDADGSVAKVEFFVDGVKVGEDTSSPYAYGWTSTSGYHSLTAKATDNSGNATTSPAVAVFVGSNNNSDLPARIMVGYWHTWNGGVPFIKLRDVNSNWDVINIAFAEPISPGSTDGRMKFVVGGLTADYTITDFKNDISLLQSQGKKIVLSIGGYEGYFSLGSSTAVTQFVNDIKGFVNEYGFDGIDIDTEQSSVQFNPGADPDFKNPTSPKVVNMISAIRQIVDSYDEDFILSWAPETFYFQMGKQFYGGLNGNVDSRSGVYIPMIHALRDRTTYVHAQLYNSPPIQGPDGSSYTMGTVEGIVAMCELVLQGFNVNNNSNYFFPPLRPDQVVIGVPASAGAAGSGQVSNSGLQQAFSTLVSDYPTLRGIMTWSINWDALQNNNSFVISNRTYLNGLGARTATNSVNEEVLPEGVETVSCYPNPVSAGSIVHIRLDKTYESVKVSFVEMNGVEGEAVRYQNVSEVRQLVPAKPSGLYLLKIGLDNKTVVKKIAIN